MDRDHLHSLLVKAGIQKIRPTGGGFQALCPFHVSASGQASWKIDADSGLWLCHKPSCSQTGNFPQFLVRCLGMPLAEAIQYANTIPQVGKLEAEDWRLPQYEQRWVGPPQQVRPERLLGLYAKCPRYMLDRGFPKPFLKEFDIGYDEWGYPSPSDPTRVMGQHRVTFPVRDATGKLAGFTRRATPLSTPEPKYLHDVEGAFVGQHLYLYERVVAGSAIGLTEGTIDALMARLRARQAFGIPTEPGILNALGNMCAVLGSGCTEAQATLVARKDPSVVYLGFDCWKMDERTGKFEVDAGGVSATSRTIRNLRTVGITDIQVLTWPPVFGDLGDLDRHHLPGLRSLSSLEWLRKRP